MVAALDFSDRTVLVIGGSSGIGNGIAQAFRARGATVHVWGTRATAAEYAGVAGSDLEGLAYAQVDLADTGAIDACRVPFERLDVLVQSQGTVLYRRAEYEPATFRRIVEVNLNSVMACAMMFHDALAAARGSMIVLASVASFRATRGNPAYSASKSGLLGLVRTLGEAWAGEGIRVNGIAPGFVDTKLTKVTTDNPARLAGALKAIPLGRLGTPEDMAGVALFLASPLAAYVIGQTITVDGGLTLA